VLDLDRLAEIEQGLRLERRPDPDRRVEEIGLVEDLPDRLGLVERRDSIDVDSVLPEVVDRPAQVRLAVADVRAQAEVADPFQLRDPPRRPARAPGTAPA
jgi:hypothetical protein